MTATAMWLAAVAVGGYLTAIGVVAAACRRGRHPKLLWIVGRLTPPPARALLGVVVGVSAVMGATPAGATGSPPPPPVLQRVGHPPTSGAPTATTIAPASTVAPSSTVPATAAPATTHPTTSLSGPPGLKPLPAPGAPARTRPAAASSTTSTSPTPTTTTGPTNKKNTPAIPWAVPTPQPPRTSHEPRATTGPTASARAATPTVPGTWVIRSGDHLWLVASMTLTGAWGRPPDARSLAAYWWQVVQTNRAHLPDPSNPDLVYSGDVITLPPIPPAP